MWKASVRTIGYAALAVVGGFVGSALWNPPAPQAGTVMDGPRLVTTFGVGGVVTEDGELWQYRPDKKQWLTLDESFALEGQGTNVTPLPIPVSQIQAFETFGFMVDRQGNCWLYDLENRVWKDIGSPPE